MAAAYGGLPRPRPKPARRAAARQGPRCALRPGRGDEHWRDDRRGERVRRAPRHGRGTLRAAGVVHLRQEAHHREGHAAERVLLGAPARRARGHLPGDADGGHQAARDPPGNGHLQRERVPDQEPLPDGVRAGPRHHGGRRRHGVGRRPPVLRPGPGQGVPPGRRRDLGQQPEPGGVHRGGGKAEAAAGRRAHPVDRHGHRQPALRCRCRHATLGPRDRLEGSADGEPVLQPPVARLGKQRDAAAGQSVPARQLHGIRPAAPRRRLADPTAEGEGRRGVHVLPAIKRFLDL